MSDLAVGYQPSLLGGGPAGVDRDFTGLTRLHLDEDSWVEHQAGWLSGPDTVFDELLSTTTFCERWRRLYDKEVLEPRLHALWRPSDGPLEPAVLEAARAALSGRYEVSFDSASFNLYRDGRDSVAWHRDRIPAEIHQPVVALLSLGHPRRFLLRRRGGGRSWRFTLGSGDLLVTGGECQRRFEHCVPKVASAGPRLSVAFRHQTNPAPA